ncbi:MAG: metal ABC transporter substrate-binding protein [Bacteroidetes bacterium]|nr:metal ABC transporter substrate-binding protein [Bacteroidota bacterium]
MPSLAVFILFMGVMGCNQSMVPDSSSPVIVTTLPVLGLIVKPIASEFEIQVLLQDGQSPHGFQVSPTQAKQLSTASLLIFAHPAIDGWATDLAEKDKLALWSDDQEEDAHYWTDPIEVQAAVKTVAETLCTLQPANCVPFRKRATAFSARIDSVSLLISEQLTTAKRDCFVVSHPFMTQFLDRYGIRSIGPIQPLPGHDASPRTLSRMMAEANQLGCKTMLVQRAVDNRSMHALAQDLGIQVLEIEAMGTNQPSYESYLLSLSNAILSSIE